MYEYFFAHDYQKDKTIESTLSDEEKLLYKEKNQEVYYQDIKQTYQEIIWTK
jgi:hypothetical protein